MIFKTLFRDPVQFTEEDTSILNQSGFFIFDSKTSARWAESGVHHRVRFHITKYENCYVAEHSCDSWQAEKKQEDFKQIEDAISFLKRQR